MPNAKKTVLITDDNEKNRKLLRVLLQKAGYATIEAMDGQKGVEAARLNKPGLIIMDIRMPVMDGITAIKALKADPATAGIPVIISTSSAMKGDADRIKAETGCDMYVTKPIEALPFLDAVKKFIRA